MHPQKTNNAISSKNMLLIIHHVIKAALINI